MNMTFTSSSRAHTNKLTQQNLFQDSKFVNALLDSIEIPCLIIINGLFDKPIRHISLKSVCCTPNWDMVPGAEEHTDHSICY
jgi:hypothetical protein